jgi:hypothetical protein
MRMSRVAAFIFGTMVGILPVGAQSPVAIFMQFDQPPGSAALAGMKREVEKLLGPAGILPDWRLLDENRGDVSYTNLVLLRFKGKCRAEGWRRQTASALRIAGESGAMGTSRVSAGRVLPFSEVECDVVREALGYLPPGVKDAQFALGLALGRVVAHELYHVLANTTGHGRSGLAKPAESLRDLVSAKEQPFAEEDARAIRTGVSGRP